MRALSRLSACIAPFCLSLTAIGGRPAAARAGIPAFTRSPARLYSAGSQLLKVSTDADGITTIAMAAKPVNALGLGLMGEMVAAFRALQTGIEGGTQAVILTSETKVFSAGLDLPFLLSLQDNAADKAKFTEYATMLKDLVLAIRTCPVPTVAAVNGAAPAGGTVLMLLCDYRLAAEDDKVTIGLSEASVGITAPGFVVQLAEETMGPHLADRHLQLGRLLGPNVALHHNLIDQVVSPSELLSTAAERCKEYIAVPFHSRSGTKARGAAAFVQLMEDGHEELVETLWKDIVREGPGSFKDIVGKMLKK